MASGASVMAVWSGWLATVAIVFAVLVPIAQRVRTGKRAAPGAAPIRLHVIVGLATAALAFAHTMMVIPALGSPAAIGGGVAALLPAGAAFFLLVAHAGLGMQLREPRLKDRARKRRMHTTTAALIALAVTVHVVLLERAGR
jgi:heme/copper-type cytochrome/quinol oxidase subunit 2